VRSANELDCLGENETASVSVTQAVVGLDVAQPGIEALREDVWRVLRLAHPVL
jgi:hypothetical protein